jgi:type IV secretory pathway VirB2 component (pilin)
MKRKVKIAAVIGIVASGLNLIFNGWHIVGIIALALFSIIFEATFHFSSKPAESVNPENE